MVKRKSIANKKPSLNQHNSKDLIKKSLAKAYVENSFKMQELRKLKDSQQKGSRNRSGIKKSISKSRNCSNNSLIKSKTRDMKSFNSVLNNSKRRESNQNKKLTKVCSPEESKIKQRSDHAQKSGLTSSTTTYTNNARKKKSSEKQARKKIVSYFDEAFIKKQKASKNACSNANLTTVKISDIHFDMNANKKEEKISKQNLKLCTDNLGLHNKSYDKSEERSRTSKYALISNLKQRHSLMPGEGYLHNKTSIHDTGSKCFNKNLGEKSQYKKLKIKNKTNYKQMEAARSKNMTYTYDQLNANINEAIAITGRSSLGGSKTKRKLSKIKSVSTIQTFGNQQNMSFMSRKKSVGMNPTAGL